MAFTNTNTNDENRHSDGKQTDRSAHAAHRQDERQGKAQGKAHGERRDGRDLGSREPTAQAGDLSNNGYAAEPGAEPGYEPGPDWDRSARGNSYDYSRGDSRAPGPHGPAQVQMNGQKKVQKKAQKQKS